MHAHGLAFSIRIIDGCMALLQLIDTVHTTFIKSLLHNTHRPTLLSSRFKHN